MSLINKIFLLDRIHYHIEHKSTGTPEEFAAKLNISVRQLYRIMEELKDRGIEISYDGVRSSYVYKIPVRIHLEIKIGESDAKGLTGKYSCQIINTLPYLAAGSYILACNSYLGISEPKNEE